MLTTTFYSYKGGVGRTLALANVASELAKRGKNVLVADFDLEAPGLSSFSFNGLEAEEKTHKGLVEFVTSWLKDNKSPDVREFCYQHPSSEEIPGNIWVMPSGLLDESYGSRLQQLDFKNLYDNHNGFLLFEDLKAQWERILNIDYVLIDSRTGHTDVGGVCTRQLPDVIAFVFWPNVQNFDGLSSIVSEVNIEEKESGKKIQRIFVPSNLPTLDDENNVLKQLLIKFRNKLSYDVDSEVKISNYPSIDLLEQKIFILSRPNSRLSKEYENLTDLIVSNNITNVDGAKIFLRRHMSNTRQINRNNFINGSDSSLQDTHKLNTIFRLSWKDGEINRMLAYLRAGEGEFTDAIQLMEKVSSTGDDILSDYLSLSQWMITSGIQVNAYTTINKLLDDVESSQRHVIAALRLVSRFNSQAPSDLEKRLSVQKLSFTQVARVADTLRADRTQVKLASRIVNSVINRPRDLDENYIPHEEAIPISLCLIGAGDFHGAISILEKIDVETLNASHKQSVYFNIAMAKWGINSEPLEEDFRKVLENDIDNKLESRHSDANYMQCLAVCAAVLNDDKKLKDYVNESRKLIESDRTGFSCWSYLDRGELGFVNDLEEIKNWPTNKTPLPVVFRGHNADNTDKDLSSAL